MTKSPIRRLPVRSPDLAALADEHGTPCYVYSLDHVRDRVAAIRDAFGGSFLLGYAVKANPMPALLSRLRGAVDRLDVSSGGEIATALGAGWPGDRLGFTGPAKREAELRAAVAAGVEVVLESLEEARLLDAVAGERRVPVLVRIAPDELPPGFGVRMAGRPTRFGFDEGDLEEAIAEVRARPRLDLRGFHVFSGTQSLDAAAVASNFAIMTDVFRRAAGAADLDAPRLVFGAGFGIPYHEGDEPLDLAAAAAEIRPTIASLRTEARFARSELVLETGRSLVGDAGVYLTRVVRMKRSRGTAIAILDGGMHHHLAASGKLGSVIPRPYRVVKVGDDGEQTEPYDLAGPLCTSVDTLGHGVRLPPLEPGDLLAVLASGAYGLTASPVRFIGHPLPAEVLVEERDGDPEVIAVTPARS